MILDLDIGNSKISWLLSDSQQERLGSSHHDAQELARAVDRAAADLAAGSKLQQIRVSCVIQDEELRRRLLQKIGDQWQLSPLIAKVKQQHAGLTTNYEEPSRLGVDRWLAMLELAGRGADDAWLVIDAGTAVTLDLLTASVHLGGLIIPGTDLMTDAFYQRTKLSPQYEEPQSAQSAPQSARPKSQESAQMTQQAPNRLAQKWGVNTHSCLTLGCATAVELSVKQVIDDFYQEYTHGKAVITGGGGAKLQQKLKQHYKDRSFTYESHLVCRGLASCFK